MEIKFKYLILFGIWCLFFGAFVPSAHAGLIVKSPSYLGLQNGLVGCWTFDGSYTKAPDCSGNGNIGTLTNGPLKTQGKIGEALSFDGVNKYVSIADAAYNFNGNYTVSAWVKPASFPSATEDILSKIHSAGPTDVFLVEVDNTSGRLRHLLRNGSGTVFDINSGTTNLVLNTWQHVIVTYDTSLASANAKIYLNGVQVGSGNATAVATITSVPIEIGRINLSNDFRYWNGSIDDVRVFNRALSASEIARMYKIGLGSKQNRAEGGDSLDKGLVGHWDFDGRNISGTRSKDSSSQNNHGTLTNGPLQATGKLGQALSFDGTNDYVDLGTPASLRPTTAVSVSAWAIRTGALANFSGVVDSGKDGSNNGGYILVGTSANKIRFYIRNGGAWAFAESNSALNTNQWYHLVGVWDGATVFLYVNGALQSTTASATSISYGSITQNAAIGVYPVTSGSSYWPGPIDDVRIYNRTLSVGEINRLYQETQAKVNATKNSLDYGLIGHWTLDGKDIGLSGTQAKDRSGNNNNGTFSGGVSQIIGRIGQALNFDGVDDLVTVTHTSALNAYPISISFWFTYPTDNCGGGYCGIVNKYPSSSASGYNIYIHNNGILTYYFKDGSNYVYDSTESTDKVTFTNGPWHNYTWIVDAAGNHVYLDGVLKKERAWTGTPAATVQTQNLFFGKYAGQSFWKGSLDDVRIYNRALGAGEVNKLWQMGR